MAAKLPTAIEEALGSLAAAQNCSVSEVREMVGSFIAFDGKTATVRWDRQDMGIVLTQTGDQLHVKSLRREPEEFLAAARKIPPDRR